MKLTVRNEHGLHARPAAAFVQAASRYRAQVQITNLTAGRGPAQSRSILAVLGLGVQQGHEVLLQAEGEDAAAALQALAGLLDAQSVG